MIFLSRMGRWVKHRWICAPLLAFALVQVADQHLVRGTTMFAGDTQHFRFYEDDDNGGGPEADSSELPASSSEDTNITRNNDADSQIHLRYLLEETAGGEGAATDDYTIQYQINGAGGWVTVTASSARVQADTGSLLTDDGATTNRATNGLTDGSGTFVAGIQEEGDGEITDFALSASNFTEHLWAVDLIAADNADTDTLDFRMARNASIASMTQNVTPRITITKTAATGAPRRRKFTL